MDAHKALITNIFNNATLIEVPFFQRPYVWNEELWAKFIEDIQKYYPYRVNAVNWAYRLPFRTAAASTVDLEKEQFFAYLDQCMEQIRSFESDLMSKFTMDS